MLDLVETLVEDVLVVGHFSLVVSLVQPGEDLRGRVLRAETVLLLLDRGDQIGLVLDDGQDAEEALESRDMLGFVEPGHE